MVPQSGTEREAIVPFGDILIIPDDRAKAFVPSRIKLWALHFETVAAIVILPFTLVGQTNVCPLRS